MKKCSRTCSSEPAVKRLKTSQKSRRNFADHPHRSHLQPLPVCQWCCSGIPGRDTSTEQWTRARCSSWKRVVVVVALAVNTNRCDDSYGTEEGTPQPELHTISSWLQRARCQTPVSFVPLLFLSLVCFSWSRQQGTGGSNSMSSQPHCLFNGMSINGTNFKELIHMH